MKQEFLYELHIYKLEELNRKKKMEKLYQINHSVGNFYEYIIEKHWKKYTDQFQEIKLFLRIKQKRVTLQEILHSKMYLLSSQVFQVRSILW